MKVDRSTNWLVKVGMWITVIAAALWAGGYLIKQIEFFLPYALGAGIAVLAVGMFLQFRSAPKAEG